jgi:hypothetical protein
MSALSLEIFMKEKGKVMAEVWDLALLLLRGTLFKYQQPLKRLKTGNFKININSFLIGLALSELSKCASNYFEKVGKF